MWMKLTVYRCVYLNVKDFFFLESFKIAMPFLTGRSWKACQKKKEKKERGSIGKLWKDEKIGENVIWQD